MCIYTDIKNFLAPVIKVKRQEIVMSNLLHCYFKSIISMHIYIIISLLYMASFPFNKLSIIMSNIPKVADTQSLLKFSEIRNDTLIMKDGSLRV